MSPRAREVGLPADEQALRRPAVEICDQDGVVLMRAGPAPLVAQGGAVEITHTWSRWERAKWCAAWLLTGLALGAILTAVICRQVPA